jgi:hypothetical protein
MNEIPIVKKFSDLAEINIDTHKKEISKYWIDQDSSLVT